MDSPQIMRAQTARTRKTHGGGGVTIFELVKIALDELYADGRTEYGAKIDDEIVKRLVLLSTSYGNLWDRNRKAINYKDPATRFAYVCKYVAAHGDYIVQVLQRLHDEFGSAIFTQRSLRISCIGGGPGSDVIGILKYLNEANEPVEKVICYLLDGEQAWADVWTELDESLHVNVALNSNFQPFDVVNPSSWQSQKKFFQADIFTMSYFVSEVMSLDKDGVVSEFWEQLLQQAKAGALFLYVDNGHTSFTAYFDEIWKSVGLELSISGDNTWFIPRYDEQASELCAYSAKFDHNPKIKSRVTYRVLRKPG